MSFKFLSSKTFYGILTGAGTILYHAIVTGGVTASTIGAIVTTILVGVGMRDAVAKNGTGQ